MKYVSFSFDNIVIMLLYIISNLGQIILISVTTYYPRFLFMLIDSLSLLFFVILEDISLIMNREKPKCIIKSMYGIKRTSKLKKGQMRSKNLRFIIYKTLSLVVLGALTVVNSYLSYLVYLSLITGFNGVLYLSNIGITWLIFLLWFKLKMYRHHLLALIIITVAVAIPFFLDSIVSFLYWYVDSYSLLIGGLILLILVQPLREVIEKYALDHLYIRHTEILFYEGVISMIINLLIFGIIQIFNCEETMAVSIHPLKFCSESQIQILRRYLIELFGYQTIDTLYAYMYIIATILLSLSRILINKKNGPTHRYSGDFVSFALFEYIDYIRAWINSSPDSGFYSFYSWGNLIVQIFILFGILIYNENIIIHLCKLSANTNAIITERAQIDEQLCNITFQMTTGIIVDNE